jgi:hypothetical protein
VEEHGKRRCLEHEATVRSSSIPRRHGEPEAIRWASARANPEG